MHVPRTMSIGGVIARVEDSPSMWEGRDRGMNGFTCGAGSGSSAGGSNGPNIGGSIDASRCTSAAWARGSPLLVEPGDGSFGNVAVVADVDRGVYPHGVGGTSSPGLFLLRHVDGGDVTRDVGRVGVGGGGVVARDPDGRSVLVGASAADVAAPGPPLVSYKVLLSDESRGRGRGLDAGALPRGHHLGPPSPNTLPNFYAVSH